MHIPHTSKALYPQNIQRGFIRQVIYSATALLDPKCQLCSEACTYRSALCSACLMQLPHMPQCCPVCALPTPHGNHCGDCLRKPKPYQRTRCALLYENPVSYLMHSFKNHSQWDIGRMFCEQWLNQHQHQHQQNINGDLVTKPATPVTQAIIVPVPSHPKHSAKRGYTPSIVLAQHLSRSLNIPMQYALKANREPKQQKTLCRKQRLQNLHNVFEAPYPIPQTIILVDDVVTSCATAIAASHALQKAGAKNIEVWAIARTPLT